MSTDYRNSEIARLRNAEHMTLEKIGNVFSISRQRVQQILGRTGYIPFNPDVFWRRVKSCSSETCWPWTGAKNRGGYGHLELGGKRIYAHRLAFELTYGPISEGLDICHSCDNPICCNPSHLFSGTAKDNIQDSIKKGRFMKNRRSTPV